jgi:hypothetical protein
VGAEKFGRAGTSPGRLQRAHHRKQRARIVARLGHIGNGKPVRLQFVLAAEAHVDQLPEGGGHRGAVAAGGVVGVVGGDHRRPGEALGQLLLGQLLGAVAAHHVADFVGEDARQFSFAFKAAQERAGDKDLAPGQGQSVHRARVVEQVKFEAVGAAACRSPAHEPFADAIDPLLALGVARGAAVLPLQLRQRLQPEGNLLLGGDCDVLLFTGDRVDLGGTEVSKQSATG